MGATTISIEELLAAIDAGESLLLLDVRNSRDFGLWRIEGRRPVRTIQVPYFAFVEDPVATAERLPRDVPIVVACAHGGSSELVADVLRTHGFTARSLDGGLAAYGAYLEPVRVPSLGDEPFTIWQLQRRGRGCLSYVVHAGDEVLVVDPSRHVERYEQFAAALGARIALVVDTHLHADHVSGGTALAARHGAGYFVGPDLGGPESADAAVALALGRTIVRRGSRPPLALRVIPTPGHTPEGHCVVLGERFLLSGDTLLAHGVGRPDLGSRADLWARDLYETVQHRLAFLDDDTVVLPAHAASGDDGPSGLVATRLGDVRRELAAHAPTVDAFVRFATATTPPPPQSYPQIVACNRRHEQVPPEVADEWELGRNECAAAASTAAATATEAP